MKRKLLLLGAALLLAACHTIDESHLKVLSPITFGKMSDVINVSLGQPLVYQGLAVESTLPLTYQWAYGKRKTSSGAGEWEMDRLEVISTDPQINYVFTKLGTYILRLRVDNGEDIAYKYFTLNVNSGLDEGLLVLTAAEDGDGSALAFIKKRTPEEEAAGDQEVWEDIFSRMNPGETLRSGTALFLSAFSSEGISYNHLLLSTHDADGTIYDIEPKTMTVITKNFLQRDFGTWCCDFSGRNTAGTGAYTFLRGGDGRVFRHDLSSAFITERTDVAATAGPVERSHNILYSSSTGSTYCKSAFYTEDLICQPDVGTTTLLRVPDGWKILNFCTDRDANRTYVLMQSKTDPSSWQIKYTTGSLAAFRDAGDTPVTFTASAVNMDAESIFCASLRSNDVYYSFGDRIYRWGMTGIPPANPAITLPAGERICDLATNFNNTLAADAETLLFIATYNPARSGRKGSVYVYDIATDSLVKAYEGVCDRPVRLLYKYRIS